MVDTHPASRQATASSPRLDAVADADDRFPASTLGVACAEPFDAPKLVDDRA